jgi:hypothetical protein
MKLNGLHITRGKKMTTATDVKITKTATRFTFSLVKQHPSIPTAFEKITPEYHFEGQALAAIRGYFRSSKVEVVNGILYVDNGINAIAGN